VREHLIDGQKTGNDPELGAGVLINQLGFRDITRGDQKNIWVDWGSGAAVRQGMPVRLEKIAA
jgi:tetrathionate reductase subunit A